MSWVTNVFSTKHKRPSSDTTDSQVIIPVARVTKCAAPIAENIDKLQYEQIKNLVPLRNLNEQEISVLSHKILTYAELSVIFIYNQPAKFIYYILEGVVTLQPNTKETYDIKAGSLQAHFPLNSGAVFGATALANTEVKILVVPGELTRLWSTESKSEVSFVELNDLGLPEELASQAFFQKFSEAYQENKLALPSLPDVALKLKKAMDHDIGVHEAVTIIQLDPAIVAKLIQVANSPLYAPVTPITNCQDAVARLGLVATRNLVTSICLKQLFKCKDKRLTGIMRNLWRRSLQISSLSFVLAEETGKINPDDALLAGLVSDIGAIPLLYFAAQHPEECPDIEQLEAAIPYIRGPVGKLMLHTLGFPEELTNIPRYSEDWHYDSGQGISLIDIVILARLHSYFGAKQKTPLPYINSIPAYAKLKEGELAPDFSLSVLQRAKQRIKDAMSIFA